jgi:hypothetical protein
MSACRRRAPAYPRSCLLSITRGEGRGSPADRHPKDEVVRTLMRLAVTDRRAMVKFGVRGSGGGLLLGSLNGLPIAEPYAVDDLAQAPGAIEPTPVAFG